MYFVLGSKKCRQGVNERDFDSTEFVPREPGQQETGILGLRFFCGLHRAFAAVHDRGSETAGEFVRELIGLVASIDVDRLSSGVDDDFAMMAGREMFFDLGEKIVFDLAVEVVR